MKHLFSAAVLSLAVFSVLFCGCGKQSAPADQEILVNAISISRQDMPLNIEYPAQIEGSLNIDVRAQVGGILKERLYTEGTYVEKDTPLFIIDPQPYEVALQKAQGALAQAQSEVRRTKREYDRMSRLIKENAISVKEHDDSLSAYERAKANEQVAQAGLDEAQINLGYTTVKAPITGITGKEAQSVGSLISPTSPTASLLTTMVQTDPLYINFSVPSREWDITPKVKEAGNIDAAVDDVGVKIILSDGSVYPEQGKIFFVDSSEDTKTASVAVKAQVANHDRSPLLLPGKFVKVKLTNIIYKNAILVPVESLIQGDNGYSVYVVKDGVAQSVPVQAYISGSRAFVREGLKVGDVVIKEGLVKVKSGQKVRVNIVPNDFTAD